MECGRPARRAVRHGRTSFAWPARCVGLARRTCYEQGGDRVDVREPTVGRGPSAVDRVPTVVASLAGAPEHAVDEGKSEEVTLWKVCTGGCPSMNARPGSAHGTLHLNPSRVAVAALAGGHPRRVWSAWSSWPRCHCVLKRFFSTQAASANFSWRCRPLSCSCRRSPARSGGRLIRRRLRSGSAPRPPSSQLFRYFVRDRVGYRGKATTSRTAPDSGRMPDGVSFG